MVRNLLERVKRSEDINSVHEFVEYMIGWRPVLKFLEDFRQKYQQVKRKIIEIYHFIDD